MVAARKNIGRMVLLSAVGVALMPALCIAQNCSTTQYPYPLQNGGVADAGQVMADLDCAPVHGLASYNGNVGIGLANLPQKLWVQNGEIWASGNSRLGFSTDGSYDNTPNVAFGASGNDAYIANWSSSAYNVNLTVLGENGNVGIGVTHPTQKLWVENGEIWASGNSRLGFSTDGTYDDIPNVAFGASGNDAYIANWNGGGYYKNFVVVGANGFVGIGTTSPAATLHVNGSAILSQGYSMTSDARLKRDVRPITEGLDIVLRLAPVRYTWKPVAERTVGKDLNLPLNVEQVGFLAQDLEKVVPEAVNMPATADQTYSINEDKLIPILVQAIKDQQVEIQKLNARIGQLERKK